MAVQTTDTLLNSNGQLDHQQIDDSINYNVCSILISTLCELTERSYTIQYQKASKQHINMDVLNSLISLITFFVKIESKNSPLLLKQLFVHIFFNPAIWIYCSIDYSFKPKGLDGNRLTREQIIEMRHYMLLYLKQFVISSSGTQEEELQAILNYLHTGY
ncbi:unnamed protein product [Rotaria sordida]|uniref:DUF4704 domain-containing protein n=1 Tax=Rotaria sordida TaxID=392033 RepID=A0A813QMC8_9BILA|nr:unnamed protein product [Rotaria sordida]